MILYIQNNVLKGIIETIQEYINLLRNLPIKLEKEVNYCIRYYSEIFFYDKTLNLTISGKMKFLLFILLITYNWFINK